MDLFRYEQSGELHGLTIRGFTQDDAHILYKRTSSSFIKVIDLKRFSILFLLMITCSGIIKDKEDKSKYIGSDKTCETIF